MKSKNVITVNVPSDKIVIDRLEAALRLKIPPEYTDENIAGCEKKLRQVLVCRYACKGTSSLERRENLRYRLRKN